MGKHFDSFYRGYFVCEMESALLQVKKKDRKRDSEAEEPHFFTTAPFLQSEGLYLFKIGGQKVKIHLLTASFFALICVVICSDSEVFPLITLNHAASLVGPEIIYRLVSGFTQILSYSIQQFIWITLNKTTHKYKSEFTLLDVILELTYTDYMRF